MSNPVSKLSASPILKSIGLALLSFAVSGCVTEAIYSRARADAKSWIGHPIQEVIDRYGEPKTVKPDGQGRKYNFAEYADYSYDYDVSHYEHLPDGRLQEKVTTQTQTGYYTCISVFYVDASGVVTDATAKGECQ
jgi:hypothetical protein